MSIISSWFSSKSNYSENKDKEEYVNDYKIDEIDISQFSENVENIKRQKFTELDNDNLENILKEIDAAANKTLTNINYALKKSIPSPFVNSYIDHLMTILNKAIINYKEKTREYPYGYLEISFGNMDGIADKNKKAYERLDDLYLETIKESMLAAAEKGIIECFIIITNISDMAHKNYANYLVKNHLHGASIYDYSYKNKETNDNDLKYYISWGSVYNYTTDSISLFVKKILQTMNYTFETSFDEKYLNSIKKKILLSLNNGDKI